MTVERGRRDRGVGCEGGADGSGHGESAVRRQRVGCEGGADGGGHGESAVRRHALAAKAGPMVVGMERARCQQWLAAKAGPMVVGMRESVVTACWLRRRGRWWWAEERAW